MAPFVHLFSIVDTFILHAHSYSIFVPTLQQA